MYLKRHIENAINKVKSTFPILLITGARQVGKTTVLKEMFGREYAFTTMDDLLLRNQINETGDGSVSHFSLKGKEKYHENRPPYRYYYYPAAK